MNITWIIGNGFDIRCGLETTYNHFYKWLAENKNISDNGIYAAITKDGVNQWSDLEKKLGEYSKNITEDEFNKFEKDIEMLTLDLVEYLQKEEKRIDETQLGDVEEFSNTITSFFSHISPAGNQELRIKDYVYSDYRTTEISINMSYISLNYTDLFQRYWEKLSPLVIKVDGISFKYQFQNGCNIHNTLKTGLVLGCDNVTQCNPTSKIVDLLIKPEINKKVGELNDEKAAQIISKTDFFILFGTSIGETDKTWWNLIAERCLTDTKFKIIIFNYNAVFNKSNTPQTIRDRDAVINRFISRLDELDQDTENIIRSKIIASEDIANMFQMKPTLKPKNSSPGTTGRPRFNYSSNNGKYWIGSGDMEFELKFSKASNTSIHMASDSKGIESIALATSISEINQIKSIDVFDFTSRVRTPQIGNIVIIKNTAGYYAAVKLIEVTDDTRGDEADEVEFDYVILNNKSYDFSTSK